MKPRTSADDRLQAVVHAPIEEIATLLAAAGDRLLNEDLALVLLRRRDLPAPVVEALGKNPAVARLRTVRFELILHPRAPRHTSLPLLRHLYPFELMRLATVPHLAADLKRAAEEDLVRKAASLSSGERLTLAKQGSSRVVAEMLPDAEPRISEAALDNPRLTEEGVVRALLSAQTPAHLAAMICHHSKWRTRLEVQRAALRCEFTPLAFAIKFAAQLPVAELKVVLSQSRLVETTKEYLVITAERRRYPALH